MINDEIKAEILKIKQYYNKHYNSFYDSLIDNFCFFGEKNIDVVYDGMSLIYLAAIAKNYHLLELLIKTGCNVNYQTPVGETPLMIAVYNRDISAVKLILSNGADISLKNKYGRDAFYYTCNHQNDEILQLLRAHKAAMNDSVNELSKKIDKELITKIEDIDEEFKRLLKL